MKEIQTYGRIEGGRLSISYRQRFLQSLSGWADCRVVVIVKKIYKKRSNEQNAYLHGVVIPEVRNGLIYAGWNSAEIGTDTDVKNFLKSRFARKQVVNPDTGEVLEFIQPTSEMSTAEMTEFIEQVRQFASEYLGVDIPSPNEQLQIFDV